MSFRSPLSLRRCGALAALAALTALAALPARAADEPDTGGIFTAPGYPLGTPVRNAIPGVAPAPRAHNGHNNARAPPQGNRRGAGNRHAAPRPGRDPNDAFPRRAEPAPPPKPNEFQRFVEGATGRLLPIFGSRFFADAADTYRALDNVPVSADYTIGPGDEVLIRAWGSIDVDYRSTVDRNGMLNLPKVGSFNVAGVKAADLEKNLRGQLARLYNNFELSVSLGQLRGLRVFVVGPAQRPGVITLSSQSTLLSAVVAAGGPSSTGSMRKILLRRDGKVISELDVYEFLVQGDKSKDMQLAAGDVVVFQPAGPRVALTGAIDTPAIYELKTAEEPLREVLRYAGGAPVLANPNRVQLERIDPSQPLAKRFVETFRLDSAGLQKALRDGDVLTLLAISPQFANAVTLKGHVAAPLRYPFTPGMRIRDLIPDRDALITADFYRRKNLLVQMIDDDDRLRTRDENARGGTASTGGRTAAGLTEQTRNDREAAGTGQVLPDGARNDRASGSDRPSTSERRTTAGERGVRADDRRCRRPLAARARGAGRGPELGLRDDRTAHARPEHAGHRLQPRQGGPARRRRQQRRARARRRRHDLQPEGHPRAGGEQDTPRPPAGRGQRAGRLSAPARRDAQAADRARRRLQGSGLCLRPRAEPRGDARAAAREPGDGDDPARGPFGGAGGA